MASRESALRQSVEIQEAVIEQLHRFGRQGQWWALTGGATEDDGENVRVTIHLETRYARPPVERQP